MVTSKLAGCSYCKRHSFVTSYLSMVRVSFCEESHLKESAVQKIAGFSTFLLSKMLKMSIVVAFTTFLFSSTSRN